MAKVTYSNEDINRFWLQIMGDISLLILNALSPEASEDAQEAREFSRRFDALLARARQKITPEELSRLNRDAFAAVQEIRQFILSILRKIVTQDFFFAFKPTILNNMVSLADQYTYLLVTLMQGRQPSFDPIIQDIFWLPFFVAQAKYIGDNVGYHQLVTRKKAEEFANILKEYWASAYELQGITRIGTNDFPIVHEHRRVVDETLRSYAEFLVEILQKSNQKKIPGTLSTLFLDASYRILCFYVTQLAVFSDAPKPACDPASPRLSLF